MAFTRVTNHAGLLTKRTWLDHAGDLQVAPAANLTYGSFERLEVAELGDLPAIIHALEPNQALMWGVEKNGVASGDIAAASIIASQASSKAMARSKENFVFSDGPGLLMLDLDLKDAIPHVAKLANLQTIEQLRDALVTHVPELALVPMLALPSATAMLYRAADNAELRGLTGGRIYIPVASARQIPDLGRRIHERLLLSGFGFAFVSKSGTVQARSIIDASVWSPERLDFVGGAACSAEIVQRRGEPIFSPGLLYDYLSDEVLAPLELPDVERLQEVNESVKREALPRAQLARNAWEKRQRDAGRVIGTTWSPDGSAPEWLNGEHEIVMSNGSVVSVDEILADPAKYHMVKCADPLEPEYGGGDLRLARIFTQNQTSGPTIHSFAHGGIVYRLRSSASNDFAQDGPGMLVLPSDRNNTDMGNASRFAHLHQNRTRYSSGEWWTWDECRWAQSSPVSVMSLAKEVPRSMHREASNVSDEKARNRYWKWAQDSESEARLRAMTNLAKGDLSIDSASWNSDPFLLNVLNGTLDLRAGGLRPHDRSDLITKIAPVEYSKSATCPRWRSFLARVLNDDRELIDFVQRMAGYGLTGSTDEQVFFFLYGHGANGKSTFLETLRFILGDYAMQTNFTALLERRGDGPRNDIARLHGARFVTASEAGRKRELDESVVKMLTGGDTITARFLYREEFEFRPAFKLFLAANDRPKVAGDGHAFWRRVRLVPFLVTIPEDERDPNLLKAFQAEASGILNWAIEGCLKWQGEGLSMPSAVAAATADYRAEVNEVAAFIQERCQLTPGAKIRTKELYDAYSAWKSEQNGLAETQREFDAAVETYNPARIEKYKSTGVMFWRGLQWKASTED